MLVFGPFCELIVCTILWAQRDNERPFRHLRKAIRIFISVELPQMLRLVLRVTHLKLRGRT